LLVLPGWSCGAFADDYIFEFGVSMKQPNFTIKGVDGGASSLGKLTSGRSWLPTVGISSPNRYFDSSDHWGYYYFGNLSYSKIDRQTEIGPTGVGGQPIFMPGTFSPIYARQAEAGAAVFVSFGDKLLEHPDHGKQFKMGLGIGLGYASLKGTVPGQYMQNGLPEYIHTSGWGTSANLILRQTIDAWYLELNLYSATLNRKFKNYSISDGSLTLGYRIPFDF